MQFKHPELLYALFLLVIPIIVHLFQLRKFRKTEFTNVKFLKNITLNTRRSSQLKKWLTLFTRLLLLASIILAFAQPYISKTESFNTKNEMVIYLDNSFSMHASGSNGTLLNLAIQDIIEYVDEDDNLTLFTNDKTFSNTTLKSIKNDLIKLQYTPNQLSLESVMIKGKSAFSNDPNAIKNLLIISDFQRKGVNGLPQADSSMQTRMVQLKPLRQANISIDSIYITERQADNMELQVMLSNFGDPIESLPVSLFNDDKLVAKSTVSIDDKAKTTFVIAANELFNGKVSIEDPNNLLYDNSLYFNLDNKARVKVMSINNADDEFLRKIYTEDEFEYISFEESSVNFRQISEQNLMVLNEMETINISLNTAIQSFVNDGGYVLIIPSNNSNLSSYNQLYNKFGITGLDSLINNEKRITDINFDHPLFLNVFDKKVTNFQYPKVSSYYRTNSLTASKVLSFEDGTTFLSQNGNLYSFTAAIDKDNSNFKNSPLIVPVFYNIGKQSLRLSELYYTIGTPQRIDVMVQLSQDEILTLREAESTVIPLQQTYSNKVSITTDEFPEKAGIISIENKDAQIKNISFNYNRNESDLQYHNLSNIEDFEVNDSVATAISDVKSVTNVNELWKWFVIFAVIFVLIETLILKYLK